MQKEDQDLTIVEKVKASPWFVKASHTERFVFAFAIFGGVFFTLFWNVNNFVWFLSQIYLFLLPTMLLPVFDRVRRKVDIHDKRKTRQRASSSLLP